MNSGVADITDMKPIEMSHPTVSVMEKANTPARINAHEQINAEFRLRNVEKSMALRVSQLTDTERDLVIDQILSELPFLVGNGLMHPFDALFAHLQALGRQNMALDEAEVEKIKANYIELYPYSIVLSHEEIE